MFVQLLFVKLFLITKKTFEKLINKLNKHLTKTNYNNV